MSKKHLIVVAFDFKKSPDISELVDVMNVAIDWIQITKSCWILWTSSSCSKWLARIDRYLEEGDEVFISELNIDDYALRMDQSVSNFIQSKQSRLARQS